MRMSSGYEHGLHAMPTRRLKDVRHTFFRSMSIGVALVMVASCSGDSSGSPTDESTPTIAETTTPDFVPSKFSWEPCAGAEPDSVVTCSTLEVPYDYADPQVGSFTLFVKKRSVEDPSKRIGSLLVNPGGPGFGGSSLADDAYYYFSSDLLERFDIIAWDPRGTGESTPAVDCVDTYDEYFGLDSPPDNEEEIQALVDAAQKFSDACLERSGEILPYISTADSARDMNSIRLALGEDKVSYLGFSYGSELGATWTTLFPDTVRAAVLDGAVDPDSNSTDEGKSQAKGFEQQLTAFLAQCSARVSCKFHNGGDAEGAFDKLLADIDANPLVVSKDRTPVTQGVAYTAVAQAMYSDFYWPQLAAALSDAQRGDGAGLLSLNDQYYQRQDDGTYGNELEAFLSISCLDDPGARSVEEVNSKVEEYVAVAPRLGANFGYGYGCALWPVPPAPRVEITGKGAGPIVVVGTTGDAATPLESTRKMAKKLEQGILIVVSANQHTGYGANACVTTAVDDYLIDLVVPTNDLTCEN
jgi:pimeloyl-ACP methyl ester carboxylesterase